MRRINHRLAAAAAGIVLSLAAVGLTTAPAAAATPARWDQTVTTAAQEWTFMGFYGTYDDCYWAGFDGWNEGRWFQWRCPLYLGIGPYMLLVA